MAPVTVINKILYTLKDISSIFSSLVIKHLIHITINFTHTTLGNKVYRNRVGEDVSTIIDKPTINKSMFMVKITNHIVNQKKNNILFVFNKKEPFIPNRYIFIII